LSKEQHGKGTLRRTADLAELTDENQSKTKRSAFYRAQKPRYYKNWGKLPSGGTYLAFVVTNNGHNLVGANGDGRSRT